VAPQEVQVCPLGQLADGDEGDRELLAGESSAEGESGRCPLRIAEATSVSTTT
jgi:hypothetical protein